MKPVIFLDIDGVLNIAGWKPAKPETDWPDLEYHKVQNGEGVYPMWLSKAMGERLCALDAEIQWLTTWGHDAVQVAKIIGLPLDLEVAAVPQRTFRNWKLDGVIDFHLQHPDRPFVWLDDDAITPLARKWLDERVTPCLGLDIDEDHGITIAQFEQIELFLAEVR
jgi:hypothetical protein